MHSISPKHHSALIQRARRFHHRYRVRLHRHPRRPNRPCPRGLSYMGFRSCLHRWSIHTCLCIVRFYISTWSSCISRKGITDCGAGS